MTELRLSMGRQVSRGLCQQYSGELQTTISFQSHLQDIVFKLSTVDIVVGRISIYKLVEEKRVEWKAPVLWARVKCVIFPDAGIVKWIDGGLVLVEVIGGIFWVEPQGGRRPVE